MQIGMIGLGRMGANMVRRLLRGGHDCVVYDRDTAPVEELAGEGAHGASSLDEFVAGLTAPRTVRCISRSRPFRNMAPSRASRSASSR